MKIVTWILSFYPPRWRERYQEEMLAVLEQHTISLLTLLDLLLGALDARLDPAYRTQEGWMFHRLRDTRTLSLIYMCALAMFLYSASLWVVLIDSLGFQGKLLEGVMAFIVVITTTVLIPALSLIALLVVTLATLKHALTQRQGGTLLFAIICLGLGIVGGFGDRPFFGLDFHFPLWLLILGWLPVGVIALGVGVSLFVTGVKGLQAIRNRQWVWGMENLSTGQKPPGGFLIGNAYFISLANFISSLLLDMYPYLLLGTLLLTLAGNESSTRSWRVTRSFGAVLTVVLVVNLAAVAIWDVNCWLGGFWIFDPTHGVRPLFGGQWIGPSMTNALILTVALSLALFALIRGFLIQPGEEQSAE